MFKRGVIIQGMSNGGKSCYFKCLKNMLGEKNVSDATVIDFASRFKLAKLRNKMLNLADDADKKPITAELNEQMKKIISGESILVERKGIDAENLQNVAKLFLSCNEFPPMPDPAMLKRFVPFKFKNFFPESMKSDDLSSSTDGLTYLLTCAVKGLCRLLSRVTKREYKASGFFTSCALSEEAKEELLSVSDSVGSFINETIPDFSELIYMPKRQKKDGTNENDKHTVNAVYENIYKPFCSAYGLAPVSVNTFKHRIVNGLRGYGIKLVSRVAYTKEDKTTRGIFFIQEGDLKKLRQSQTGIKVII